MSSKLRNCLPMFDATCLLYGGYDVSFSFVFLFVVSVVNVCGCWLVLQFIVISTFFEGVLVFKKNFFRASW